MNRLLDLIMEKLLGGGWADEEDAEIVRYGLELNIMKTLISAVMLLAAFLLRSAPAVIVFMLAYPPLRSCCGGFHARTRTACFIYSMLILAAVIAATKLITGRSALYTAIASAAAGAVLVCLLAPVEAPNKPFDDIEKRVFRRRSLIAAAAVIAAGAVMWAFSVYGLMLPAAMALLFTGIFLAVGRLSNRKGAIS
ncbi:MAG: accessory gene regulator B family protein [Ruminococcus sp.]|nr:accessory gene regulator B family protein [Ruminococcus sp.]